MEIHYFWRITQIVRDIPFDQEFPTSLVSGLLRNLYALDKKASPVLDDMRCLKRVHTGSLGGHGESRDPNIYIKKSKPGRICHRCDTATCMIRHTKMASQIGLDQKITIPLQLISS